MEHYDSLRNLLKIFEQGFWKKAPLVEKPIAETPPLVSHGISNR